QHADFGGRVTAGFNAFGDNTGTSDCNGHGTHVAGVIGGATFGVAKSTTLVPVRALDCNGSGSVSTLLAALDWILQDHALSTQPAVVNMSLGGDASAALDAAVNRLLAAGLTTIVAAGNNNEDACRTSPARVPGAITVGAMTETDQRASFSNYGPCIDLFAPGSNIRSDWFSSPTATAVTSGTSASAPFVTGTAALVLEKYPSATPTNVSQTIQSQATLDALGTIGAGSPNRLLFSLISSLSDPSVGDAQLLSDPSFEYGTIFWKSDICAVVSPTGCPPMDDMGILSVPSHSGNNHASIGGTPQTFHLTSEPLTIPATVRSAELSFYLWIVTKSSAKGNNTGNSNKPDDKDDKKHAIDDVLTVEIRDQAGSLLSILGAFSNLDECSTYLQRRFDVSRYRGKTIRIAFTGIQNPGPPTWFLLDDVGLNVRR
ncbi:MAG: S8 family peptidase, partial [Acidobacteriota bacterium]